MRKLLVFLLLLFSLQTTADSRVRIWDRIPPYFVYDRVRTFMNEQRLTNCFEYRENTDYLRLKCWRDKQLTNVDITILPDQKKKDHYFQEIISAFI